MANYCNLKYHSTAVFAEYLANLQDKILLFGFRFFPHGFVVPMIIDILLRMRV